VGLSTLALPFPPVYTKLFYILSCNYWPRDSALPDWRGYAVLSAWLTGAPVLFICHVVNT